MRSKGNILWVLLSLVFVVVFNIIVFLVNSDFTSVFWVSYVSIHIAYLMLVLSTATMPKVKNFVTFGYPLIYLSNLYFIGAFLIGIIFMYFHDVGFTVAFIPQLIIAGLYAIAIISNLIANENTIINEEKDQYSMYFIKNAASEINYLMRQTNDTLFKKKLERLYDCVRNSQVRSNPNYEGLEKNITYKLEELKRNIFSNNYNAASNDIDTITQLLLERDLKITNQR